MPISNIGGKIAREDKDKLRRAKNPPAYESGFEPDGGGLVDLLGNTVTFDSLETSGFTDFNSTDTKSESSLDSLAGLPSVGKNVLGGGDTNSGLGNWGGNITNKIPKEDNFDKFLELSGKGLKEAWVVLKDVAKSFSNRNAEDIAFLSRNLILTGLGVSAVSVIIGVLGLAAGSVSFGFAGLAGQLLGGGALVTGSGLFGIGLVTAALLILNKKESSIEDMSNIKDIDKEDGTVEFEDLSGDMWDNAFGASGAEEKELEDDFSKKEQDDIWNTLKASLDNEKERDSGWAKDDNDDDDKESGGKGLKEENLNKYIDNITENKHIDRITLFNTFKDLLPTNTPNFSERREIVKGTDEFEDIEALCLKALSNVAKCEIDEIDSYLDEAYESCFNYELKLKRAKGVNKFSEIKSELEAYFRSSSDDVAVTATVDREGDFYKIIISKGKNIVVTFGDVFTKDYVCKYYKDRGKELPFIVGISEKGEVILDDARGFDAMMLAGKPRSGKSWYALSILTSWMLFNTPNDIQFILIDPKESYMFKVLALMPHVIGLHNHENIIEILTEIKDVEGDRRKKLLSDHRCDDIWELRRKGIKLPVLCIFMDEIITIKRELGTRDKEFDALMQVIMSKLPSQGIRIVFVPHRATGVVDKTNRTMLSYIAAARLGAEDVKDTLGITKWNRELVAEGDIAVKLSNRESAFYVKGGALATSNEENAKLISTAAKAFYKMGVDMPDMDHLTVCINRDEDRIREELQGDGRRVQYNVRNMMEELE